jgi:hypothetical protein
MVINMNFIRKITNSEALKHIVDLPDNLRNQEIILPLGDHSPSKQALPSSYAARGSLKQYANADLIQYEQDAWERACKKNMIIVNAKSLSQMKSSPKSSMYWKRYTKWNEPISLIPYRTYSPMAT